MECLHLDIIVITLASPNNEVDAVVVHFGSKYVAPAYDELHLDEVFRILAELQPVQAGPVLFV
jgi:hypothetical protein